PSASMTCSLAEVAGPSPSSSSPPPHAPTTRVSARRRATGRRHGRTSGVMLPPRSRRSGVRRSPHRQAHAATFRRGRRDARHVEPHFRFLHLFSVHVLCCCLPLWL